jgi:hypothetical protein
MKLNMLIVFPVSKSPLKAPMNESGIDSSTAVGYGLDAGALLRINENLCAGLAARNVVATMAGKAPASDYGIGIALRQQPFLLPLQSLSVLER